MGRHRPLPAESTTQEGGRPRIPDRACLAGIIFVLKTGIPWQLLPRELGCGSGSTCWRRLRDWQAAGVWTKLHERLLNWLSDQAAIDWSRVSVDSISVRANKGARRHPATPLGGSAVASSGLRRPHPFVASDRGAAAPISLVGTRCPDS